MEIVSRTLAERSHSERYESDSSSVAAIRPDGRIGWANAAWFAFARDNWRARAVTARG